MPRARTLYIHAHIIYTEEELSISSTPTPSACDRSSDCDTSPKPYRRTWYQPILVSESTYIGRRTNLYRLLMWPIQVNPATNIGSLHPLYESLENDPIRELFPLHLGRESPGKKQYYPPAGWSDSRPSAGDLPLLILGISQHKGFAYTCQK